MGSRAGWAVLGQIRYFHETTSSDFVVVIIFKRTLTFVYLFMTLTIHGTALFEAFELDYINPFFL